MSFKDGGGKSLKGNKSAQLGGAVDMKALLAALTSAGVTLINVTLQNMIAFSGMMDDVMIGTIAPSSAVFTKTQIGMPDLGGQFIIYGDKPPDITYDEEGNIVSQIGGDKVTWDPTAALFHIEGSLQVRDSTRLGNIVIRENQVVAIAPEDGNVEILPQSDKGFILLGGNINQNLPGTIHLDQAKEFSVDSDSYGTINSRNNNSLTTERGDIVLATDVKSLIHIQHITHQESSTKENVSIDEYGTVTQVVTTQEILGNISNAMKETTTIDRVIRLTREIVQRKTVIDGKISTITDTTVTTYDPETDTTDVASLSETATDSDPTKGDPFERISDATFVTHKAIVKTLTPHGYHSGDAITISGTNSVPLYDGAFEVLSVTSPTEFELAADGAFMASDTGNIFIPKIGSIHLSASNFVRTEIGVPIIFGAEGALSEDNPYIEAISKDVLEISANYIQSMDPMIILKSPSKVFSDSGIAVNYTSNGLNQYGFFGFVNNTANFTWIPSATIVRNPDGSKTVLGERGIMELKGIQLKEIFGDPNITVNAPEGGIYFNSHEPINISPSLSIGNAGGFVQRNGELVVTSNGQLYLESVAQNVSIPASTSLSFSDTTSIKGNPSGGLTIASSVAPVTFQSDVSIPHDRVVTIGSGTLVGHGDDVIFANMEHISMNPTSTVRIPDDVYLQIGHLPLTGLMANNGTLNATSVSNLNLASGGNTKIDAAGTLTMNVGGGLTHFNSTQVKMPARSELMFSTHSYISTMEGDRLTIYSDFPVNVNTSNINLNATSEVTIPDDVPLRLGVNSTIFSSITDAGLHLKDPNGVYVDENLTVTGALTVYGPVTEITSTHTMLQDPIITLGTGTVSEHVKDRGVEFRYGDGLYGFMGYSQQDSRFYLVKEGRNVNEVFTKDVLGDIAVKSLFADIIFSSGGFGSKIIQGDPYLTIDATHINLSATDYIRIPTNVPLIFGTDQETLTPTHSIVRSSDTSDSSDSLIITAPSVSLPVGNLNIGSASIVQQQDSLLVIDGISTTSIRSTLIVPDTFIFGQDVNDPVASIITDSQGNLTMTSSNHIYMKNAVRFLNEGLSIGDSNLTYDPLNGTLSLSHLHSATDGINGINFSVSKSVSVGQDVSVQQNVTVGQNLSVDENVSVGGNVSVTGDISIMGGIIDARWAGDVIETAYGGTGRRDNWHNKSVVFVTGYNSDDPLAIPAFLDEDPAYFVYDSMKKMLGLQTDSPTATLTIGDGNIDLHSNEASLIFRSANLPAWKLGKNNLDFRLYNESTLQNVFMVNPVGQIALGNGITPEQFVALDANIGLLFGQGDFTFANLNSAITWSTCTFIRNTLDNVLSISSCGKLGMNATNGISFSTDADILFAATKQISSSSETIALKTLFDGSINIGGKLDISSGSSATLTSTGDFNILGKNSISLTTEGSFTFTSGGTFTFNSGGADMVINTGSNMHLASGNDMFFTSGQDIKLASGRDVILSSQGTFTVNSLSSFVMNLSSTFVVNASADISIVSNIDLYLTAVRHIYCTAGDLLSVRCKTMDVQSTMNCSITSIAGDVVISSGKTVSISSQELSLVSTSFRSQSKSIEINNVGALTIQNVGSMSLRNEGLYAVQVTGDHTSHVSGNYEVSTLGSYVAHCSNAHSITCQTHSTTCQTHSIQSQTYSIISDTYDSKIQNGISISGGSLQISSGAGMTVSTLGDLDFFSETNVNLKSNGLISLHSVNSVTVTSNGFTLNSGNTIAHVIASGFRLESSADMFISFPLSNLTVNGNISNINLNTLNVSVVGHLSTTSQSIGLVSVTSFTVQTGSTDISNQEAFSISSVGNGSITAGSSLVLEAGDLSITGRTSLSFAANSLTFAANTSLSMLSNGLTFMTALKGFTVDAGEVLLLSGNSVDVTSKSNITMRSTNDVIYYVDKGVLMNVKGAIQMDANSGITLTSTSMYGFISGSAKQNVTFTSQEGNVHLVATGGSIIQSAGDVLSMTSIGSMTMTSSKISMDALVENITIASRQGDIRFAAGKIVDIYSVKTNIFSPLFLKGKLTFHNDNGENYIAINDIGNAMTIASPEMIRLSTNHVTISNRLCWHHDDTTGACVMYSRKTENNSLEFVNDIGDILLKPLMNVVLPDASRFQFGTAGYIESFGGNMRLVTSTGNIELNPGSKSVYLSIDNSLNFGNMASIKQTNSSLEFSSQMPIHFDASTLFIPDHSKLIFGDVSRRIESDGDTLFIYSTDLLSLESNTVRVSGNLIVSKRSTFTIESETHFDSGTITLGGGTVSNVISLRSDEGNSSQTIVTVSGEAHGLQPGNMVSLIDTVPNIDGMYEVISTPSATEFTINKILPDMSNVETVQGAARYALITDPGLDVGVQFNWHTGHPTPSDTTGSRTGFFGFDRSTGRFTFIPEGTRVNNAFQGQPGDFQMNALYAEMASIGRLISPLDAGNQPIIGTQFLINGGLINNTPIGQTGMSTGRFTDVFVENTFTVGNGTIVKNLNADLLDGYHADAFVLRDGSTPLLADWNTGGFKIITGGLSDTSLAVNGIVTVDATGRLITHPGISFDNGTLTVAKIGGFTLMGNVDLNVHTLSNGNIHTVTMSGVKMSTVEMTDAQIVNANVSSVTVTDADMSNVRITQGSFSQFVLTTGTITDADLSQSRFSDGAISSSVVNTASIVNSDFIKGTISTTALDTVTVTNSTLTNGTISLMNISNSAISKSAISDSDITQVRIYQSELHDVTVDKIDIRNGTVSTSVIKQSSFEDGKIATSTIAASTMDASTITASTMGTSTITASTMDASSISASSFSGGTIDSTGITNGSFANGVITASSLTSVTVQDSTITNVDQSGSRIMTSVIEQSAFNDGTLSRITITDGTADTMVITNGTLTTGSMSDYTINRSNVNGSTVDASSFTNGSITAAEITSSNFSNGVMSASRIVNTEATGITMGNSSITGSKISTSDGVDLSITGSRINTTIMIQSAFENGTIRNVDMFDGRISGSDYTNGTISVTNMTLSSIATSTISDSDISASRIGQSVMTASQMDKITMKQSHISDTDMSIIRMVDSEIGNTVITSSTMSTSAISASTISDSDANQIRINVSTMTNSTISQSKMETSDINDSLFHNGDITSTLFVRGDVQNSNISIEIGNVMDVSRGTIVFANDQIHGNWIAGGMADIDISGNSETVTNGVYRRDFAGDHTILKADVKGEPYELHVPEERLLGRRRGTIDALTIEDVQDMLDVVQKKWFKDNSILKADEASKPYALEIPDHTIVGRYPGRTISALSAEEVIQMIMTTEVLHRYGAMLRDGHRTFPDGAMMTGLLYYSNERFSMTTGQERTLDMNVETSYVSVNYSRVGGRTAKLTLGRGFADGHRKVVIASHLGEKAILMVYLDLVAPETIDPVVFAFHTSGQSAHLQWDSVLSRWLIVGSGASVLTRDDLRDPNFLENLGLDD